MAKVLPLCERGKHARPRSFDIERSPYTFLPGKMQHGMGQLSMLEESTEIY
ncbi:hypothetical protein NC652_009461 [Populus alba x Populus x berolinensis]|nr:hypothetical protein NC652_009461 [Populus alba x Populus x berolinensis]